MAKYEASIEVQVTLTYHIVHQVEAQSPREAESKLQWEAMGMSRQELDLRCDHGDVTQYYDGQETTVAGIGEVEEVPENEEVRP